MPGDLAIGLDVGGTKIAAGVVSRDSDTIHLLKRATPHGSGEEVVGAMAELITELLSAPETSKSRPPIGVGLPAQIDFGNQRILFCTNLPLKGVDVAGMLSSRFDVPVVIDNDANLAALAEARFGAASACSEIICITLGTGIGGGLIFNGKLYRGWLGTGAEVGHIVLDYDGAPCGCGGKGHFETLAAGPALERKARAVVAQHPESRLAQLAHNDPDNVRGPMITQLARDGDPTAIRLLAEIGAIVGQAIASLANLLNPQIVVVGGGMIEAGDMILEPARRVVATCAMEGVRQDLRIVPGALANNAGYLGAAELAFEHFDEKGR